MKAKGCVYTPQIRWQICRQLPTCKIILQTFYSLKLISQWNRPCRTGIEIIIEKLYRSLEDIVNSKLMSMSLFRNMISSAFFLHELVVLRAEHTQMHKRMHNIKGIHVARHIHYHSLTRKRNIDRKGGDSVFVANYTLGKSDSMFYLYHYFFFRWCYKFTSVIRITSIGKRD